MKLKDKIGREGSGHGGDSRQGIWATTPSPERRGAWREPGECANGFRSAPAPLSPSPAGLAVAASSPGPLPFPSALASLLRRHWRPHRFPLFVSSLLSSPSCLFPSSSSFFFSFSFFFSSSSLTRFLVVPARFTRSCLFGRLAFIDIRLRSLWLSERLSLPESVEEVEEDGEYRLFGGLAVRFLTKRSDSWRSSKRSRATAANVEKEER